MLKFTSSTPFRLRPRRHDVGAALMRKFRQNGVAVSGDAHNGGRRVVDALHAMMLTVICFTAAIVMDDRTDYRISNFLDRQPASSVGPVPQAVIANRIAPPAPEMVPTDVEMTGVRLSSIEDEPEALNEFPRAPQPRVAGEEKPAATSAAEQPLRAAALHLGEQALRTIHR